MVFNKHFGNISNVSASKLGCGVNNQLVLVNKCVSVRPGFVFEELESSIGINLKPRQVSFNYNELWQVHC